MFWRGFIVGAAAVIVLLATLCVWSCVKMSSRISRQEEAQLLDEQEDLE